MAVVSLFLYSRSQRGTSEEATGEKGSGPWGDEEEAEGSGKGEAEWAPEATNGGKWKAL